MNDADKYFTENEEQIEAERDAFARPTDNPLCLFRIEFKEDGANCDALISSDVDPDMVRTAIKAVQEAATSTQKTKRAWTMSEKPDCYQCKHRRNVPGDCHSSCANSEAGVAAEQHGIDNGWFNWPYNFDPIWLGYCDGFEAKEEKPKE